jgi:hypothetical protein
MEVAMTAHRTILFSAAVIGLSLANPPDAGADLCFRYGTGGGTLVARDATLPKEGTCQSFALFENTDPGSRIGAANGMICRDGPGAGGVTIVFHYTYDACVGPGSYFESATCRHQLNNANDLPTASGFCRGMYSTGSGPNLTLTSFLDPSLKIWQCTGEAVPGGGGGQCFAGRKGFSHKELDEKQSSDAQGIR